jgi:YggT family protein
MRLQKGARPPWRPGKVRSGLKRISQILQTDACVGAPPASGNTIHDPMEFGCELPHTQTWKSSFLSPMLRWRCTTVRVRAEFRSFRRMITTLFWLAGELLGLYTWAVILAALFSMLASFGVIDTRNRMVWSIGDFLFRITEPALRPIRNVMPNFGSIDISPLVLLLLLQAARMLLERIQIAIVTGALQYLI